MLLWGLVAVAIAVPAYLLFGDGVGHVVAKYKQPEFSHGYIIPLLSGWLLWQRRKAIAARMRPGDASGLVFVLIGLVIALASAAANLDSVPYLGLVPFLFGLSVTALGWPAARLTAVPIGLLLFGYYIPSTAYILISTNLQLVSSQIGAGILDYLGVPVFLSGNIIDLGSYQLQVAEACSGLRYLMPLFTFGAICAYLYNAPLWAKAVVVVATVPITIAFNGARIAMTGLFIEYGSEELAEGFMHLFEGWVVFLLALACLVLLMWLLLRVTGRRATPLTMLDFDRIAGAGAPPAAAVPATGPRLSRPLVASVLATIVAAPLLLPLELRPHYTPERPGLVTFPPAIASWRGTHRFLDPQTEAILGADDYLLLDFVDTRGNAEANLWVAYYDSFLKEGSQAHLPTTCLPAAGWEYVELGRHRPGITDLDGRPLEVQRGVIVHGTERIVMYFWLELRGRHAIGQEARLMNIWDSITIGRSDGALVRIYTPLAADEEPSDGDARLSRFLETVYPNLEPHVGA